MSKISFRRFTEEDIEPWTAIMTEAFDEDSMLFRSIPGGHPEYNDGSFLCQFACEAGSDSHCIYVDGKLKLPTTLRISLRQIVLRS